MQIRLIFIRKVVHLASFESEGFFELVVLPVDCMDIFWNRTINARGVYLLEEVQVGAFNREIEAS